MRTPGKGTFVRSFGIITQSGFLVNIQASPTEECGGVFASVPIGGIVFVGRAGGGDARACVGVRDACDTCDTVEVCGAMCAILWRCAARGHFPIPADGGAVRAWYNADCARVWGVRWRVRRAREYGAHGGYVLRRSRIICIMFRAFECARVSRVQLSAKYRRRLWRGGFFADLQ